MMITMMVMMIFKIHHLQRNDDYVSEDLDNHHNVHFSLDYHHDDLYSNNGHHHDDQHEHHDDYHH